MILDDIVNKCRSLGYSKATAKVYRAWCEQYIRWAKLIHGEWVHPSKMGRTEIEAWLSYLAVKQRVSAHTQNLALQSVLFMYKRLLGIQIEGVDAMRAKRSKLLPKVISREAVGRLMLEMHGEHRLLAGLLYGAGLRVGSACSLRLKDIDLERQQIQINSGKGKRDNYALLPECLVDPLRRQIERCRHMHLCDTQKGRAFVELPDAFNRKSPKAAQELRWYWLFPSHRYTKLPETGVIGRGHIDAAHFSRVVKDAANRAGILQRVTPHTLRHCFATHLSENGVDVTTIQALMGHENIETTQIYLHADKKRATATRSPMDELAATLANQIRRAPEPQRFRTVG